MKATYSLAYDNASDDIDILKQQFETLTKMQAELPIGESSYWTLPRKRGEWRPKR